MTTGHHPSTIVSQLGVQLLCAESTCDFTTEIHPEFSGAVAEWRSHLASTLAEKRNPAGANTPTPGS